jgi:cellulose synthase/poly-beta-1,6-N-acetylglucosamine synthase-like glycosyltransferase
MFAESGSCSQNSSSHHRDPSCNSTLFESFFLSCYLVFSSSLLLFVVFSLLCFILSSSSHASSEAVIYASCNGEHLRHNLFLGGTCMIWTLWKASFAGNVDRTRNLPTITVLYQCPALIRHRMEIRDRALLEPIEIVKASLRMLLALRWASGAHNRMSSGRMVRTTASLFSAPKSLQQNEIIKSYACLGRSQWPRGVRH